MGPIPVPICVSDQPEQIRYLVQQTFGEKAGYRPVAPSKPLTQGPSLERVLPLHLTGLVAPNMGSPPNKGRFSVGYSLARRQTLRYLLQTS